MLYASIPSEEAQKIPSVKKILKIPHLLKISQYKMQFTTILKAKAFFWCERFICTFHSN